MSATNDGPYFGDETLDFLEELSLNNNRDWFTAHKPRYESFVRDPALAFVRAMAPRLERLAPSLIADDRKMGGSLMRIYRDTRFSKDKTPYKTNIGIHFRHKSAKDVHAPGLYVHVGLDGHFVGVGTWKPDAAALAAIRRAIAAEPERFLAIVEREPFASTFARMGDSVKRAPKGYANDHPLIDELKRTSHIATSALENDLLRGPQLATIVEERLRMATDFMGFICSALGERL